MTGGAKHEHHPTPEHQPGDASEIVVRPLNLRPAPPERDILKSALTIDNVPAYTIPDPGWLDGLKKIFRLFSSSEEKKRREDKMRIDVATALLMASLSPAIRREIEASAWVRHHNKAKIPIVRNITHPYSIIDWVDIFVGAPPTATAEKFRLERLIMLILTEYARQISITNDIKYSFEAESREHFLKTVKFGALMKRCIAGCEQSEILQGLFDCLYHAKNYYIFSLISRESQTSAGKGFLMYCNAVQELSKFLPDGTVSTRPLDQKLPRRGDVLSLFQRDRSALKRFNGDGEFRQEVGKLMKTFPP